MPVSPRSLGRKWSESERGVNPCERYHRNGTGGVVTCTPSSHHSGLLHTRPVPDTPVRARGDDIIQPKAPPRKGEGLLCPSVPRAKDRARPDVDPCAPPRPPLTPLARFLIGARLCACVYPSNVGVRTRTTLLLSSRPRSRVLRILRGYFWWRPVALLVLYERARFSRVLALFR